MKRVSARGGAAPGPGAPPPTGPGRVERPSSSTHPIPTTVPTMTLPTIRAPSTGLRMGGRHTPPTQSRGRRGSKPNRSPLQRSHRPRRVPRASRAERNVHGVFRDRSRPRRPFNASPKPADAQPLKAGRSTSHGVSSLPRASWPLRDRSPHVRYPRDDSRPCRTLLALILHCYLHAPLRTARPCGIRGRSWQPSQRLPNCKVGSPGAPFRPFRVSDLHAQRRRAMASSGLVPGKRGARPPSTCFRASAPDPNAEKAVCLPGLEPYAKPSGTSKSLRPAERVLLLRIDIALLRFLPDVGPAG